jgi:hypothetical protein
VENLQTIFFAYWPIKNNNDRGDHIFFFIKTKQETFEKVLLNIIPSKFGYNWPRSFNEDCNVKSLGDRRQVMESDIPYTMHYYSYVYCLLNI